MEKGASSTCCLTPTPVANSAARAEVTPSMAARPCMMVHASAHCKARHLQHPTDAHIDGLRSRALQHATLSTHGTCMSVQTTLAEHALTSKAWASAKVGGLSLPMSARFSAFSLDRLPGSTLDTFDLSTLTSSCTQLQCKQHSCTHNTAATAKCCWHVRAGPDPIKYRPASDMCALLNSATHSWQSTGWHALWAVHPPSACLPWPRSLHPSRWASRPPPWRASSSCGSHVPGGWAACLRWQLHGAWLSRWRSWRSA